MASMDSAIPLDPADNPCKRLKIEDFSEEVVPCGSQHQIQTPPPPPIYSGPGAAKALIYHCVEGLEDDKTYETYEYETYEHTIYFKGDFFTVREDVTLNILEEEKHLRPPEDKKIRNVQDPSNKDFLESLKNEKCPTEFSNEREGLHFLRLIGLCDEQELKAPAMPRNCDVLIHRRNAYV